MKNDFYLWKVPRAHRSNFCCVIDTETSGREPGFHEILQIAIQPLDSNYQPRKGVHPFYLEMKPNYPERAEKKALQVNGMSLEHLAIFGTPQETAADMLIDWFQSLQLQGHARLMPMAHNWPFDFSFIASWLGPDLMNTLFSPWYRDTMELAIFLDELAWDRDNLSLFTKFNLKTLANKYGISYNPDTHDALHDSLTTAKLYVQLMNEARGIIG